MPCAHCGYDPLPATQERCPECGNANPAYAGLPTVAAKAASAAVAAPRPSATREPPTVLRESSLHVTAAFAAVGQMLDRARYEGCKIIANLGLSGAGKSFLIARMANRREAASNHAYLYKADGDMEHFQLKGKKYVLPRTSITETLLWRLPGEGSQADWLVVDIAGELVQKADFIDRALREESVHNLVLMTLAQADALKITLDGKVLAQEMRRAKAPELDREYQSIINELARVVPWLHHFRSTNGMTTTAEALLSLRAAYAKDPTCAPPRGAGRRVNLPVLLLITKADHFNKTGQHLDALKLARKYLPLTYEQSRKSLHVHRWQLCAPFLDQPVEGKDEESEHIDMSLKSYGVGSAVRWLESELASPGPLLETLQEAQRPVARWVPGFMRPPVAKR